MITNESRIKGCFFGAIIGDVLGAPYEFKNPSTFNFNGEMSSGGPFNLKKGYYTDDTSMMLCIAKSIVDKGWDVLDQCLKFVNWMENGYMSSTKTCFDIGNQTFHALNEFDDTFNIIAKKTDKAGNGALMRLAPVIIYSNSINMENLVTESTIATHNNDVCIDVSKKYSRHVKNALNGIDIRESIVNELNESSYNMNDVPGGYVLSSYYHCLDSFVNTAGFKDCMIHIINKGGDTDTNACIAGMLAGAFYGYESIESKWLDDLKDKGFIESLYNEFYTRVTNEL